MPKAGDAKTESGLKSVFLTKSFGFFVLSVVLLWGIGAWILLSDRNVAPICTEQYRHDKTISIGQISITAQTATTSQAQEQGLGGRRCLGLNQSMLFVFNKPGYYPFWMKDMKFNIDILWISPGKAVTDIQDNVSPSTYPKSFINSHPAQYVLELAANRAGSLGLRIGSQLSF